MSDKIEKMTDDDFKKIMQQLGMPESMSLYSALKQVENHTWQAARAVPDGWKMNRDGRWISITQPDGKGVKVRLNLEGHQDAAATLYRLADAMLSAAPKKEGE